LTDEACATEIPVECRPRITFVVPSRNDAYGGGQLRRLDMTVSSLIHQAERHKLVSELILVDWNPPADQARLKDALHWPERTKYCTVRAIEVPPQIHQQLPLSDKLPILVHRARNVGIRRARGQFILPLGTDVLLSDPLMQYLASAELDAGVMYRTDRFDVPVDVLDLAGVEARLAFCAHNVMQVHTAAGTSTTEELPLHTNAAGDFTMLSRDMWDSVHGIPEETQFHPLRFDGVLCYLAYRAGARELVLKDPLRLYHVDHESSWRPQLKWFHRLRLPGVSDLWNGRLQTVVRRLIPPKSKLEQRGVPLLSYQRYRLIIQEIVRGKRPDCYSDDDWGLTGYDLPESTLIRAAWDASPS